MNDRREKKGPYSKNRDSKELSSRPFQQLKGMKFGPPCLACDQPIVNVPRLRHGFLHEGCEVKAAEPYIGKVVTSYGLAKDQATGEVVQRTWTSQRGETPRKVVLSPPTKTLSLSGVEGTDDVQVIRWVGEEVATR